MTFSEKLKQTRIHRGYTQTQLANLIGVTPAAISRYENGIRKPNAIVIRNLAITLGISSDELLCMNKN